MNVSADRLLFGLILLVSATILVMMAAEELPKAYWALTPPVPEGSEVHRTLETLGWNRAEVRQRDEGRLSIYLRSRGGRQYKAVMRTAEDGKLRHLQFLTDRSSGRSEGPIWRALSATVPSALQALESCEEKMSDGPAEPAAYNETTRTDWKVTLQNYIGGPKVHTPVRIIDIRRVHDNRVAVR